jgi:hypothetical protein
MNHLPIEIGAGRNYRRGRWNYQANTTNPEALTRAAILTNATTTRSATSQNNFISHLTMFDCALQ